MYVPLSEVKLTQHAGKDAQLNDAAQRAIVHRLPTSSTMRLDVSMGRREMIGSKTAIGARERLSWLSLGTLNQRWTLQEEYVNGLPT